MKLLKNNEVIKEKWDKLIESSKFSSPFQTLEGYNLYNSVEGYSSAVFAVENAGIYEALVVVTIQKEKGIKGVFSIRGIVYGGPLVLNNSESLNFLLKEVNKEFKKKLIYLEIRNQFDYSEYSLIFENNYYKFEEHLNVQLEIGNKALDDVLGKMKGNRRREVKNSYKQGAVTRLAKDESEVLEFYTILKDLYKTRVKLPLSPYDFFIKLYKSGIGKVFVVTHEDMLIGGAFCLYSDNLSINSLYYAGLRNYDKKIFPTHLAIMEVIKFAIDNNLKMVDFMGAGKPNVKYGVRDYKLQFGGDLVQHGRSINVFKPKLFNLGVWGLKVLSKVKK